MLYFVLVLLLMNVFSTTEESDRSTSLKSQRKKPFAALVFSNTNNLTPSDKKSCQWLSRLKHQSKICWKRRGLPEVLLNARNLSITHCQSQFEFDQWNCSKREFFLKKIYRETALMYSMASSAVMFSVARACSEGTLAGCRCGDHGKPQNASWQWGGCGDNSKFAKKFTKKFLQLKKRGDGLNSIIKYNSELGIKVVLENEEVVCRCHGVSGTCTVRICWKKIRSFDVISKQLKAMYYSALQIQPENSIRSMKGDKSARQLLFLESSPNFCLTTANRPCNSTENCATLCCGRGTYPTQIVVDSKCNCRWRKQHFDVQCDYCKLNRTILRCR
ncbi:hypothetical protein MTP99_010272 [Tenebrio molitor]|nr:hypothetical protein MTP99_010272 [Tenebrio molitor]CAH1368786.1 unnamed protein product [Tenebrio molitor]